MTKNWKPSSWRSKPITHAPNYPKKDKLEEVEQALKHHPGVYDVVVTSCPSERWGQEVVAVIQLREGIDVSEDSLLEECGRHISRYKYPKVFIYRDQIVRSSSGKADYRWAASQIEQEEPD